MVDIRGEAREQTTMFPVTGDELIPADHSGRVIEAFVDRLDMAGRSGRSRAGLRSAGSTDTVSVRLSAAGAVVAAVGRRGPGQRGRDEGLRGWEPEQKSIAEFRRTHSQAVRDGGGERVRCAGSVGGVRGQTVAVESGREGGAGKRYLEPLDRTDAQDAGRMDARAVQAALERRKNDPAARFMRTATGSGPAYNVPTAVDTEPARIVVQQVPDEATDHRRGWSMAEAAKAALGNPETLQLVRRRGLLERRTSRALRGARRRAAWARLMAPSTIPAMARGSTPSFRDRLHLSGAMTLTSRYTACQAP